MIVEVSLSGPVVRSCALVCVLLGLYCWRGAVTDGSESSGDVPSRPVRASIKLKIGALFDVRARHLVEAFQRAVEDHNDQEERSQPDHKAPLAMEKEQEKEGQGKGDGPMLPRRSPPSHATVSVIFEPVITFVDVTDSFAVSNAMCDLIAHDVTAIVGVTNASSLPTVQSYSATFHVPFLSLGSSQNVTSPAPFQLSLRPPVMAAVVDLLHHQGCLSALYMYDSDEGLMRIQDLFQAINIRELYLELDVRRIGDRAHVTEISKIIGSLHPRREICLVLDVERLDAKSIIGVVKRGAPTVKDVILVTLDAEMALNGLLQDPENHPAGFNISGLQLVPSLLPTSPLLHIHHPHRPLLHPAPSSFQRWSSPSPVTLVDKEERSAEQHLNIPRAGLQDLGQNTNTNTQGELKSARLKESDRVDGSQHHHHHHHQDHQHRRQKRKKKKTKHATHRKEDFAEGNDPSKKGYHRSGSHHSEDGLDHYKPQPSSPAVGSDDEKPERGSPQPDSSPELKEPAYQSHHSTSEYQDSAIDNHHQHHHHHHHHQADLETNSRSGNNEHDRASFNMRYSEEAEVGAVVDAVVAAEEEASSRRGTGIEAEASSRGPQHFHRSCEALIVDGLKVLTAALADLWDSLGDLLGSGRQDSPYEDMSIKCTNFVVEKKQHGADLMEALRLVHIQGETRYISFDTGGKREDYTLSVLAVRAGSTVVRNEGEWSSVTGLTSDAWSQEGVRSYTIFGNISVQAGRRRVLLGVME